MKSQKLFTLVALMLVLTWGVTAYGQSDRGSITGTVSDPNGAVVANAKVTATNLNSGEVREATTSDEGNYTLPELKADPWKVTVEAPGFSTSTIESVQVAVQVIRRADVQLQLGDITNVVTVAADSAPVIQTDSPVRQTNVTERQVKELPLQVSAESGGRTPLSFIFLDSNVTSSGTIGAQDNRGTNAARFRVSGGQAMGTEILLDGSSTYRAENGTAFTETAPGPNAFQEFTLSTSTYSAEFGRSSGGIVNFTLKSGGNEFHGEAYELHRNRVLNANTFQNNAQGIGRPFDLQHDFGFNVGGPVYLPRFGEGTRSPLISLKNRTFFFFNYEGYRFNQSETVNVSVPTLRMRQGDFGELFTDPAVLKQFPNGVQIYSPIAGFDANGNPIPAPPGTRTAIPGNRIDQFTVGGRSIIDPVGMAILQALPQPNRPGVFQNYTASSSVPTTMNNAVFKIDQVITDAQRLSLSYSFRKTNTILGGFPRFPRPLFAFGRYDRILTSHIARLQHDWTLSATLINHFNAGFNRNDSQRNNPAVGAADPFALGLPRGSVLGGAFPAVDFPGYGDPGNSTDVRSYQGIGGSFFNDLPFADNTAQAADFLTLVKGRHTLKFGGDVRFQQFNVAQLLSPGGWFNFRHLQTANVDTNDQGWPVASLITGATEWSFNSSKSLDPGWRYFYPAAFVQDDIKLTPRLTLNVGLRYEISYPRTESQNRYRTFDPNVANPAVGGRAGALVAANGQGGLQAQYEGLAKPDYTNIGPRVGFAYALNNKTVVRGGYGLYYSPILYGFAGDIAVGEGTEGYNTHLARPQFGADANIFLRNYPQQPSNNPNDQFIGQDVSYFNKDFKTGRTAQWSVDVQRELPANFAVSVGYIGSHGTRLRSDFGRLNALPFEALRLGFPLLNKNLNDVTAAERTYAQSVGFTLPANSNAVFPGFNGSVAQSLKPFPQYGIIKNVLESNGQSWYNAIQAKLGRRFSRGVQFDISYTYSRLTSTGSEDLYGGSPVNQPQNPYERPRFTSPNSTPHVLVFNYIYELPFGKGKRFLNEGGFVDKLFGGWQIGGIHRYQTGSPIVVTTSSNTGFLNLVGFAGFRGAQLRPNLTGQPILTGNDPNGQIFQIVNGGAFAQPPNYEAPPTGNVTDPAYRAYYADPSRFFGTAPAVINERILPFYTENFSLLKKTRLTETVTLELRGEFFNLFNRHRYFGPDLNFQNFNPNNPNPTGGFGFSGVIGDPNVFGPRNVQVGARLIF
jgi:hypothetical protein